MRYFARNGDGGKWAVVGQDGSFFECCKDHGFSHESEFDAYYCLWMWAFDPVRFVAEKREAVQGHSPSVCSFLRCDKLTSTYYKNVLVKHGRPLCEKHANPLVLISLYPFMGGDCSFST